MPLGRLCPQGQSPLRHWLYRIATPPRSRPSTLARSGPARSLRSTTWSRTRTDCSTRCPPTQIRPPSPSGASRCRWPSSRHAVAARHTTGGGGAARCARLARRGGRAAAGYHDARGEQCTAAARCAALAAVRGGRWTSRTAGCWHASWTPGTAVTSLGSRLRGQNGGSGDGFAWARIRSIGVLGSVMGFRWIVWVRPVGVVIVAVPVSGSCSSVQPGSSFSAWWRSHLGPPLASLVSPWFATQSWR